MANLFDMTAPLMVRSPDGKQEIVVELFPHPDGLLYFAPYWHLGQVEESIHLIRGEAKGEGPWKVGDYVFNVLGCHGTDAELASAYQQWRAYLQTAAEDYPPPPLVAAIARRLGANTE